MADFAAAEPIAPERALEAPADTAALSEGGAAHMDAERTGEDGGDAGGDGAGPGAPASDDVPRTPTRGSPSPAPSSDDTSPAATPSKPHWKALMKEREKTAPRCRVIVHPDDARDKVLMGIVRVLIKSGNIPSTPKELTAMILHWKIVRMGGATPHATISSRISQHFKRCAEANPVREPILGAWAAEGVRRLRYFVNHKGVPVAEVPKSRLEYRLQLEDPVPGKDGAATPDGKEGEKKTPVKKLKSGASSRQPTPTPLTKVKNIPLALQTSAVMYAPGEKPLFPPEPAPAPAAVLAAGLLPHQQIPVQPESSPSPAPGHAVELNAISLDVPAEEPAAPAPAAGAKRDRDAFEDDDDHAVVPSVSTVVSPAAPKKKKKKKAAAEQAGLFDDGFLDSLGAKLKSDLDPAEA
ncbi:hypothetical protein DFJ74DRAFT_473870 [Hyaloraphidium curvatum]|nr:hypothetical protein DFJ74DRAFT_473870 [Hyaloraphidium curvatum]